jgi:hypothetical protein
MCEHTGRGTREVGELDDVAGSGVEFSLDPGV